MEDDDVDWVKKAKDNPELAAEALLSIFRQPPAAVISPPVPVSVSRGDWVKRATDNPELAAEALLSLFRQPPAAVISPPVPVSVPRRPRSRTITLQGIREEEEAKRQRRSPETPHSFGNEHYSRAKPPAAEQRTVDQAPSVAVTVAVGVGKAGGDPKMVVRQPGTLKLKIRLPNPIQHPQVQTPPQSGIPLIGGDHLPDALPDLEDGDEMPPQSGIPLIGGGSKHYSRGKPPAAKRRRVDEAPSVGDGNAGGGPKMVVRQPGSLRLKIRFSNPIQHPQDQTPPGIPLIGGNDHLPDDLPDLEDGDEMPLQSGIPRSGGRP